MFRTPATGPSGFPRTHEIKTGPAPVGGLNARDPLPAMPPQDAVKLVNWIPDVGGVRSRKGYVEWAINFPSDKAVETVMPYLGPDASFPAGTFLTTPTTMPGTLFAATEDGIYDVTSQTNAPVLSQALSGADFAGWISHCAMTNAGGTFLLCCSESDGYLYYNGATWAIPTMGGGAGQIANVDPADFVHVLVWKNRAWFVERDSTRCWYLGVDSITGAATKFDFGPLLKKGGHVAYLANWTIDAGTGVDDFLVVVGSNGDVLVYKGTDPSSSTTFGLVGTWFVGQIPVGRRGYCQYGGDLVLVSAEGVFPVSYVTRGGADLLVASSKEYSSKISPLMGASLRSTFTIRGWQLMLHPTERLLLVNVPDINTSVNFQYAMSTVLNAWTTFEGIPTYCYGISAGYAFAGTQDGRVLLILSGGGDAVEYGETVGSPISGFVQPSFSYFDTPALEKIFHMARATFLSLDEPQYVADVNVNFEVADPYGVPEYNPIDLARWDQDAFEQAKWVGGIRAWSEWISTPALGFCGSLALKTSVPGDTVLASVDYMFEVGGPL